MDQVREYFQNFNNIIILGYGREGQSTYRFIRKIHPQKKLTIADRKKDLPDSFPDIFNDINTHLITGEKYLNTLDDYDLIIKSPGIRLPEGRTAKECNLSSQTDIFLHFFKNQTIGITGTKGKSTSSSLLHHIFSTAGERSLLMGNIGIPPFDIIDKLDEKSLVVFELSSHQLLDVRHAPGIGVILNLFPEHLDFYKSSEDYFMAKMNIARYQSKEDCLIINEDDPFIRSYLAETEKKSKGYSYSLKNSVVNGCYLKSGQIFFVGDGVSENIGRIDPRWDLKGRHNHSNILAAICACKLRGLSDQKIMEGISSFKGLEHRLEYVGCYHGIHYYNDSIATVPEATMAALDSIPDTDTLILGGFDRGLDYTQLIIQLKKTPISNFLFIGPAGKRMLQEFRQHGITANTVLHSNHLEEAMEVARRLTRQGHVCLLSPAAASYDDYKNFEERGRHYKRLAEA